MKSKHLFIKLVATVTGLPDLLSPDYYRSCKREKYSLPLFVNHCTLLKIKIFMLHSSWWEFYRCSEQLQFVNPLFSNTRCCRQTFFFFFFTPVPMQLNRSTYKLLWSRLQTWSSALPNTLELIPVHAQPRKEENLKLPPLAALLSQLAELLETSANPPGLF